MVIKKIKMEQGEINDKLQPIQLLLDQLEGEADPEAIKELTELCRDSIKYSLKIGSVKI